MMCVLVLYDSITGNVKRLGEAIADGARSVEGAEVLVRSVNEVTDEELQQADGIAFGSLKFYGTYGCDTAKLFERIYTTMNEQFHFKVGTAFTGSPSQYGGQEHVMDNLVHSMMQCGQMIVIGNALPGSGYIGGYVVGEPEGLSGETARSLGERLARISHYVKLGRQHADSLK